MTREKLNLIFLRFHVKSFHHRLSLGKGNATENLHISDKCSSWDTIYGRIYRQAYLLLQPNWHSKTESDDKYRLFYSFKCTFEAEKYLLCIANKWLRDLLARFRLRACGLKNHKQWFTTEQEEDLTCRMCGQKSEDETHFVFHCKAYTALRNIVFSYLFAFAFVCSSGSIVWLFLRR